MLTAMKNPPFTLLVCGLLRIAQTTCTLGGYTVCLLQCTIGDKQSRMRTEKATEYTVHTTWMGTLLVSYSTIENKLHTVIGKINATVLLMS